MILDDETKRALIFSAWLVVFVLISLLVFLLVVGYPGRGAA